MPYSQNSADSFLSTCVCLVLFVLCFWLLGSVFLSIVTFLLVVLLMMVPFVACIIPFYALWRLVRWVHSFFL